LDILAMARQPTAIALSMLYRRENQNDILGMEKVWQAERHSQCRVLSNNNNTLTLTMAGLTYSTDNANETGTDTAFH